MTSFCWVVLKFCLTFCLFCIGRNPICCFVRSTYASCFKFFWSGFDESVAGIYQIHHSFCPSFYEFFFVRGKFPSNQTGYFNSSVCSTVFHQILFFFIVKRVELFHKAVVFNKICSYRVNEHKRSASCSKTSSTLAYSKSILVIQT